MKDSLLWWIGEDLHKLFAYALNFSRMELCAGVGGQGAGWDARGVGPWWHPQILRSQGTEHLSLGVLHSSRVRLYRRSWCFQYQMWIRRLWTNQVKVGKEEGNLFVRKVRAGVHKWGQSFAEHLHKRQEDKRGCLTHTQRKKWKGNLFGVEEDIGALALSRNFIVCPSK